jgi:cytochrome c oxidase cbb3-type subunit 1
VLYLSGMLVMAWNVMRTLRQGSAQDAPIPSLAMAHA